jgi:hypothetical protein
MQPIAHVTTLEFAAGIVVLLIGMCVGPWLAHLIFVRKGKDIRNQ